MGNFWRRIATRATMSRLQLSNGTLAMYSSTIRSENLEVSSTCTGSIELCTNDQSERFLRRT
eukprot:4967491-Prymnesium_polylepis.1